MDFFYPHTHHNYLETSCCFPATISTISDNINHKLCVRLLLTLIPVQEARLKDLEHSLELKLIEAERSAQQQAKNNESTLSRLKADLHREQEVRKATLGIRVDMLLFLCCRKASELWQLLNESLKFKLSNSKLHARPSMTPLPSLGLLGKKMLFFVAIWRGYVGSMRDHART